MSIIVALISQKHLYLSFYAVLEIIIWTTKLCIFKSFFLCFFSVLLSYDITPSYRLPFQPKYRNKWNSKMEKTLE